MSLFLQIRTAKRRKLIRVFNFPPTHSRALCFQGHANVLHPISSALVWSDPKFWDRGALVIYYFYRHSANCHFQASTGDAAQD